MSLFQVYLKKVKILSNIQTFVNKQRTKGNNQQTTFEVTKSEENMPDINIYSSHRFFPIV